MIEIDKNTFDIVNLGFNKLLPEKKNDIIADFKNHPLAIKHENYKYEILEDAKNQLLLKTWKENDIGSGRILGNIKNAINVKSNNLIDWRKKDDFKKLKANRENEKFLFDFFKSKIQDEIAFKNFIEIGFSYQLIAYIFFIKNHQKYMPISQEKFDEIFSSINIGFKTSHNCSWENYLDYNLIIKSFKKQLSTKHQIVSLLDAHSFLWIYGLQLEELIKKIKDIKETEGETLEKHFKSYFNDSNFKLTTKKYNDKVSTKFELQSEKIRSRFQLSKKVKNIFSFITGDSHLLFYFRIDREKFITKEIEEKFKNQINPKTDGETTITLRDTEEIDELFKLLFINVIYLENKKKVVLSQGETTESSKQLSDELKIYHPKKNIDIDSLDDSKIGIDYIEIHRKQLEIGDLAEKIVLKSEIDFLKPNFPKLAEKVRLVSNDSHLGCDVLSFETGGEQKQIEVKAISTSNNSKSFIITQNELSKSKTYSNYYVYCVTKVNSEKPEILRIKNPDFEKNDEFLIKPLTYKITFE
ncbi:DUF3883 domain-containing protein [Polaribacter litorisediminis]|uniref:protein NO VEIN domain-containing protein n=1 Tax=Polaribacter litorisediminis TaxID=1908341 RepID=UPI001CBFDFAE|nr:DUF3883 domain-containing protein [Polaribacter litorisediminis]UAM98744.1 DUF3883 domain-containing protein [Polaribacter litorisediminis]